MYIDLSWIVYLQLYYRHTIGARNEARGGGHRQKYFYIVKYMARMLLRNYLKNGNSGSTVLAIFSDLNDKCPDHTIPADACEIL